MKMNRFLAYAALIILVAGGAIWYKIDDYYSRQQSESVSATTPAAEVVMYKNPGCQCCDKWAEYMEGYGYDVSTVESQEKLYSVKQNQGIPQDMGSCHTALLGDYVIEGHVPVQDIQRLLSERPDAIGLAAPGMPASSPGMNTALNEPYKVYLMHKDGSTEVYAQH